PGDTVISATINKNAALQINASKVGKDTALAKIVNVGEEAQGSKADIKRLADKNYVVFVIFVVLIAVITFLVWNFIVQPGISSSCPNSLYYFLSLVLYCNTW